MMLGLSLIAFTRLHVAISLVAIVAGLVYFAGSKGGASRNAFMAFTILTSVTGFMFPPKPVGPPFIFGVISLIVLGIACFALYARSLAGRWRTVFVVTALLAQWLNMIVLVVQSFQKIGPLNRLAPSGNEPVILIGQAAVAAVIAWLGWRNLRPGRTVLPGVTQPTQL